MSVTQESINEIKNLSISEKIIIVEEIWDSIATRSDYPELSESQRVELNRRIDSYHANPQQGRSWNEIKNSFWQSK